MLVEADLALVIGSPVAIVAALVWTSQTGQHLAPPVVGIEFDSQNAHPEPSDLSSCKPECRYKQANITRRLVILFVVTSWSSTLRLFRFSISPFRLLTFHRSDLFYRSRQSLLWLIINGIRVLIGKARTLGCVLSVISGCLFISKTVETSLLPSKLGSLWKSCCKHS